MSYRFLRRLPADDDAFELRFIFNFCAFFQVLPESVVYFVLSLYLFIFYIPKTTLFLFPLLTLFFFHLNSIWPSWSHFLTYGSVLYIFLMLLPQVLYEAAYPVRHQCYMFKISPSSLPYYCSLQLSSSMTSHFQVFFFLFVFIAKYCGN